MEVIAYVEDIGELTTVDGDARLIRCNPNARCLPYGISKPLPPPSLLPCYFNKECLEIAIQRYKGFVKLLKQGLKYYNSYSVK